MNDVFTNTKNDLAALLRQALECAVREGELPDAPIPDFVIEVPGDRTHGDLASNLALVSAKAFHRSPRDIATAVVKRLAFDGTRFERAEIAGAGFINIFLSDDYYADVVRAVLEQGADYGKTDAGHGKKINVEFVSANPTGPMHIGNARGGALGDCLVGVLRAAGYEVTSEFYVNDAGNQINKFATSLELRYLQHFKGDEIEFPEDCYQGHDIIEHAENYIALHGDELVDKSSDERRAALVQYALPLNVAGLKRDLGRYNIEYDVWFYESSLHQEGAVTRAIQRLTENGHTYEKDGALWYRPPCAEGAEPEKDEVLIRANGVPTYFAADIAYHYNKLVTRGFDIAVNIWGADHHGHVARLKNAVSALGLDGNRVEIVLMQLVRLMSNGETVRVSKRTGKSITLTSLLDEVPLDAARFFFNMREAGSHLDFDLELAVKTSSENPVYYVQYAHARICSILRAESAFESDGDLRELRTPDERELIGCLATLPSLIADAAQTRDPAAVTRYCVELATLFHRFYTNCRVRDCEPCLKSSRLALCRAVKQTLSNCLALLKIDAPDVM